jgi:dTMP kinase
VAPEPHGRLIALEGIDGCGKSTQAALLAATLDADLTFEPGDSPLGRVIRDLVLRGEGFAPTDRAEALLMAADRAQHVETVIRPALEAGRWVVTERFSGSTLAYQGAGRGLDVDDLRAVVAFATGDVQADLVVLIDVPAEVAASRMQSEHPDRLERLEPAFFERVAAAYRTLAGEDPDRWVVVDGQAEVTSVARAIEALVTERLGHP